MKHLAALVIAALPTAALANFDCSLDRQCGGGTCEAFSGGPLVLRETGDVWQVELDGQMWQGYASTTATETGEVSIVIPPQGGISGLISVFPSGEVAFTVHAKGEAGLVAITGSGNCSGDGG